MAFYDTKKGDVQTTVDPGDLKPNVPTEGQSYLTAVTQDRSVSGIRSTDFGDV